jgi:hypothetical protein
LLEVGVLEESVRGHGTEALLRMENEDREVARQKRGG